MVSPRLYRFNRWGTTLLALAAFANAIIGSSSSAPTEPAWLPWLFPSSLMLLAASYWVAPVDAWLTSSPARKRVFWGLLAVAILLLCVQLYWQTCVRGACVAI